MEEIKELSREAKSKGILTVIWSYPRGGNLSKTAELAVDIGVYACHMAAFLGAHIIKIKLRSENLEQDEARKVYEGQGIDVSTQSARVRHCMQAAFNGRKLVVFSGAPRRARIMSTRMPVIFAMAAGTDPSSAATPFNDRARKPWTC
jgi:class I fructose-bisphosphate aldolase